VFATNQILASLVSLCALKSVADFSTAALLLAPISMSMACDPRGSVHAVLILVATTVYINACGRDDGSTLASGFVALNACWVCACGTIRSIARTIAMARG
jgi:hypothetical protein